jgi:hypothetical protein
MSKPIRHGGRWVALVNTPKGHSRPCLGCVADSEITSEYCSELADAYGVNDCGFGRYVAFDTEEEALVAIVLGRME